MNNRALYNDALDDAQGITHGFPNKVGFFRLWFRRALRNRRPRFECVLMAATATAAYVQNVLERQHSYT